MIPRATYRLQFHRDFTFADAETILPYLDDLGISHIYASPITTARSGSTHGYDVVDPTRINPELGGEQAFRSLVSALHGRGMGIIIDIVPNHMGVAGGENCWWNDVLRHGRNSRYAHFFDIDWREKLVLPILGAPLKQVLADGHIRVGRNDDGAFLEIYGEHRVPLRPESDSGASDLAVLLEQQHYRLAWWRVANDELNWRRFFTINDLAGLRVEDDRVFEATHSLYFDLYGEGLIDGVRIDHVDGLTDPAGYLRRLRARFAAIDAQHRDARGPAYIVVEKILAPDEPLPGDWPIEGTSGYDFMADATALLHDTAGEAPLTELWTAISGGSGAFEDAELTARREMLSWGFAAQFQACVEAFVALAASDEGTAGWSEAMVCRAIERALWVFPVYRTYGPDAPPTDAAVRETVRGRAARFTPPGESEMLDVLLEWLAGEGPGDAVLRAEAVRRFQQLSAPIAAKSVEDTAFYRYGRLLSLNDVGSDAGEFGLSIDRFFDRAEKRAAAFPHAMLTSATHDHKRGEDSRARLAVLSEFPERWIGCVLDWERELESVAGDVAPSDRLMLYQALYAALPPDIHAGDKEGLASFADRVSAWQVKALREGKRRSSWEAPDADYERHCTDLIHQLLDPDRSPHFLERLTNLVDGLSAPALAASLVQTGLRYLLPGVPDCYQGSELLDLSMVDPDNRRPVDYGHRAKVLAGRAVDPGSAKQLLIQRLLQLRRAHPEPFLSGLLQRVAITGARADHVLAFTLGTPEVSIYAAMALHTGSALADSDAIVPDPHWWEDTDIHFPGDHKQAAHSCFSQSPVCATALKH